MAAPVGAGSRLGRYRLIEPLGSGGMAVVWRAEDTALRREVALKVLHPHLAVRTETAARFAREARAVAALDHPNILKVFDVGDEPVAYLVMELVRGTTLQAHVERHGPPLAEIVAMVGAVLGEALAAAHRAGIIHRDVKPANVLVTDGGRLVLSDFGMARLLGDDELVTQTGAMLGTPAFMSPEQALGKSVDPRSDVYSLGATLYQLATGSLPASGTAPAVIAAVSRGEIVPPLRRNPRMGSELARIIEKMMAREPTGRFSSAEEAAHALGALAQKAGFADVAGELAAFFRGPEEWTRAATPKVLEACLLRAREAAGRREYARALALADRVFAIEPGCAEATALVASIGKGARAWRRAVTVAVAVVGLVAAGLGAVAIVGAPGGPPRMTGGTAPPAPGASTAPEEAAPSAAASPSWPGEAPTEGPTASSVGGASPSWPGEAPTEGPTASSVGAASGDPASSVSPVPTVARPRAHESRGDAGPAVVAAAAASASANASASLPAAGRATAHSSLAAAPPADRPPVDPTSAAAPPADPTSAARPPADRPPVDPTSAAAPPADPKSAAALSTDPTSAARPPADPGESAVVEVRITPWCDITIDGRPFGRSPTAPPIRLAPGTHTLECAQSVVGARRLVRTLRLAPGAREVVSGTLLEPVQVRIGPALTVRIDGAIHRAGSLLSLLPGRRLVEILDAQGRVALRRWIPIPTRPCVLRAEPELTCYETP